MAIFLAVFIENSSCVERRQIEAFPQKHYDHWTIWSRSWGPRKSSPKSPCRCQPAQPAGNRKKLRHCVPPPQPAGNRKNRRHCVLDDLSRRLYLIDQARRLPGERGGGFHVAVEID